MTLCKYTEHKNFYRIRPLAISAWAEKILGLQKNVFGPSHSVHYAPKRQAEPYVSPLTIKSNIRFDGVF
jgi:hypothetical protein